MPTSNDGRGIMTKTLTPEHFSKPAINLGSGIFTFSETIHVYGKDPSYLCLTLDVSGPWNQITYTGKGPAIVFHNLKDSRINGLHVLGGDVVFLTDGSSSRNTLTNCRVQKGGMVFDAPNGADMCHFLLNTCEAEEGSIRFIGPNNLDHVLTNCTASNNPNGVGFDFSEGGSASTLVGCGGSFNDAVIKVNGGYQLTIVGGRSELSQTFVEATYDGPTPLSITGTTLDNVDQVIVGKKKGVEVKNVWNNGKLVNQSWYNPV